MANIIKDISTYLQRYSTVAFYHANGFDGFEPLLLASNQQWPTAVPEPDKNYIVFLNYDYKNELEGFPEKNLNPLRFPKRLLIEADEVVTLQELAAFKAVPFQSPISVKPVVSRNTYIDQVKALKQHIQLGDIYEINYCITFEAENALVDPFALYHALNNISHASYSSFLKHHDQYIISSSPELFLSKRGNRLYTKPIKGTARRDKMSSEDERIKLALYHNAKERNENVMIVDVARNDLSRLAERGTVTVEKLFDIETYQQVHQMVSTVSCTLKNEASFDDVIGATFPMASMTGAPKYRAMQLIDQYEAYNRGPYSGTLGYIKAGGDFDLNVLIRSVFYDAITGYLSFSVGSAITDLCNPEEEYDECLLKAKAMMQALGAQAG